MPKVIVNNASHNFSINDFEKLQHLLPYWGLSINKRNQLIARFPNQLINLSCPSKTLLRTINQSLKHTGIQIINDPLKPYNFIINTSDNHKYKLSILANQMTYHLKPLKSSRPMNVQKYIHKKLWLPIRTPKIELTMNLDNDLHCVEWLSYLLIQYVGQEDLSPVSHLSFSNYQQFVQRVLMPINPLFADFQIFGTPTSSEQWPESPIDRTKSPADDTEDTDVTDKIGDTHSSLFKPFKNKVGKTSQEYSITNRAIDRDETPINPFKHKKTAETTEVNPFKKNKDH